MPLHLLVSVFASFGIVPEHAAMRQAAQETRVVTVQEPGLRKAATVAPMPAYPQESVKNNVSGVAVASVRIGVDGRVEKAGILEAPDAHIAAAVESAVVRWVVPWLTGPRGEQARPRTGKLTFYFRIVGGVGRVFNPSELPGGPAEPTVGNRPLPSPGSGGEVPAGAPTTAAISQQAPAITVEELGNLSDRERPTIVDIGPREAFKRAHLPGAINIPVDELPVRAAIELPRTNRIAIDCTKDEMWRCQAAAWTLAQHGLKNVFVLVR